MISKDKEGWVYCISNENVRSSKTPNNILLKIGMTNRTPQERLAEANKSDTWRPPLYYKIEFAKKVKNALIKEKTLHKLLEQYNERVNTSREFFDISVEKARLYFDLMEGEYYEPSKGKEEQTVIRKKGGVRKKRNVLIEEDPINTKVQPLKKNPKKKSLSNEKVGTLIINSSIKDLLFEESRALISAAFHSKALEIEISNKYYSFDELKNIKHQQLKKAIFQAYIISDTIDNTEECDFFINKSNYISVLKILEDTSNKYVLILQEICNM
jgi:hypothetical protein